MAPRSCDGVAPQVNEKYVLLHWTTRPQTPAATMYGLINGDGSIAYVDFPGKCLAGGHQPTLASGYSLR